MSASVSRIFVLLWKVAAAACAEGFAFHLQVGKNVDRQLGAMNGQRLAPFGCGDEDSGKLQQQFQAWAQNILETHTQQTDVTAAVEPVEPIIEQVSA